MKTELKFLTLFFSSLALLFLVSCNLPGQQPTATEMPGTTATIETATEEAVVFDEPGAGTFMQWIDSSYVVYVPGGVFVMGQDDDDAGDNAPAHGVSLAGFWIQQAEVTNAMYALCVNLGVCSPPVEATDWYSDPEFANAPVTGINWVQAETYCEWVEARLPTEAEWEKAARGIEGDPYPWGEDEPTCNFLNFQDCLPTPAPEVIRAYPLGASPFNLADTAGNVSEWVYDWFAADYYAASPDSNPTGPETGDERVVRGSSYLTPLEELNITLRASLDPEQGRADLGFRCVLNGDLLADDTPPAPACNVLSFDLVYPVKQWPQQEPVTPPGASLTTYCIDSNGSQYGTAVIELETGTDPTLVSLSSPNGTLTCTQDANDPQKLNCGGSALQPGQWTTVEVCKLPGPGLLAENPTCPIYYTFIPNTGMCEYGVPIPVMCADPNVVIPGYGCLPASQNDECPVGSYEAAYNGKPVCVPASGPKCQGEFCQATCPEGLVFNEGNFCCDYPTSVQPTCQPGYTYDANVQLCIPEPPIQSNCTSITVQVASCPAKISCSSFTNSTDCNASPTCAWHTYAAMAGGYCTDK